MFKKIIISAILIATISCWVTNPQSQSVYPARPAGGKCVSATKVTGCVACVLNPEGEDYQCEAAEIGYYRPLSDNATAVACPRNCEECDVDAQGVVGCISCQHADFAQDESCQVCDNGFTLDKTDGDGVCISVLYNSNYSCYTGFMWDSTPQVSRKCVKSDGTCATNYALNLNSGQCDYCAQNYTQVVTDIQTLYIECLKYTLPEYRNQSVVNQCKVKDPKNPNLCLEAEDGYFVNQNNVVEPCPDQCATCTMNLDTQLPECDTCRQPTGYVLGENGTCTCETGFTADRQNTAKGYLCIQTTVVNNQFQTCYKGNNWNNIVGNFVDKKCVSITDGICYNTQGVYLSFWAQTTQPQRYCTLASFMQCGYNYAQKNGDSSNFYNSSLTTNCNQCVTGYSISSNDGQQVCVKTQFSNTLQFALLAFLSTIAFLF